MGHSIDDVIEACRVEFRLEVTDENKRQYANFLRSQLKKHPEYDLDAKPRNSHIYHHLELLAHKLKIFAYLTRQEGVRERLCDDEKILETDESLRLLRIMGNSSGMWGDDNACRIYLQSGRAKKRDPDLPSYKEIIDEIGRHRAVVKIWRRKIVYAKDVATKANGNAGGSKGDVRGSYSRAKHRMRKTTDNRHLRG